MKLPSSFAAIATGILLGAMIPSASFAQYFGRNKVQYNNYKWHVLSTPHFDIHYYEGAEAFAVRAGLVLEDGYDEYTYKLKTVLPWRVPVILYSNHADFLETNVTEGQLSEGVQAFAEPSRRRIVLPFTSSFKNSSTPPSTSWPTCSRSTSSTTECSTTCSRATTSSRCRCGWWKAWPSTSR